MNNIFFFLMLAAAIAVAGSLILGMFFMAKADHEKSQKMMRARVILQGAALVLFVLAVLSAKH